MKARTLMLTAGAILALAGPSGALAKNRLEGHGAKSHAIHKVLVAKLVPGMPDAASGAAAVAIGSAAINFQAQVDAK